MTKNQSQWKVMSNRIIEEAQHKIRELNEERRQLTSRIFNLQTNLNTVRSETRTQTGQRQEITNIGIRLIQIDREIEHYQHVIEYEEEHQKLNLQ